MKDHLLIATAYNSEARIYVSYTKALVEEARLTHSTWPTATAAFGRLLTAAGMMSFFNKDETSLTLKIDCDGPIGWILAESNIKGEVRGNINKPDVYLVDEETNKLAVGEAVGNGRLTVVRNPHMKSSYSSAVKLTTGEIADDLTYYFSYSEQIPSSVGLGVLIDTNTNVKHAGGFIVQVLPGAKEETIVFIEEALNKLKSVTSFFDSGHTTKELLSLLAHNTEKILEEHDLRYHCNCSQKYFASVLVKLDEETLNLLIKEDKGAEIVCQYCHKVYNFTEEDLKSLLLLKKTTSLE